MTDKPNLTPKTLREAADEIPITGESSDSFKACEEAADRVRAHAAEEEMT